MTYSGYIHICVRECVAVTNARSLTIVICCDLIFIFDILSAFNSLLFRSHSIYLISIGAEYVLVLVWLCVCGCCCCDWALWCSVLMEIFHNFCVLIFSFFLACLYFPYTFPFIICYTRICLLRESCFYLFFLLFRGSFRLSDYFASPLVMGACFLIVKIMSHLITIPI